jgi:chromosome segregation ATPase
MTSRTCWLVALILLVAGAVAHPQEEPEGAPASRTRTSAARPSAQNPQAAQDRALLRQLADAQRALGDEMQQLKERVEALHEAIATRTDQENGTEQEVKALREEVKGLYVESSTVREHIDALKDDIASVNSNVSAFRTYSGFFIAVMILLLAVIFVLTIRR